MAKKPSLVDEHFEAVLEDEDGPSVSDASTAGDSSEDDHTNDKRKSKNKSRVPRLIFIRWFIECFLFCFSFACVCGEIINFMLQFIQSRHTIKWPKMVYAYPLNLGKGKWRQYMRFMYGCRKRIVYCK